MSPALALFMASMDCGVLVRNYKSSGLSFRGCRLKADNSQIKNKPISTKARSFGLKPIIISVRMVVDKSLFVKVP